MMKNSVSVVIPAYNEGGYIEETVKKIHAFLERRFPSFEIIVVDDGSSDSTYKLALALAKNMPNLKVIKNNTNQGKGYSVKKGMLTAASDYILFTDADLSTPVEELDKFTAYMKDGVDVIIGSRTIKGAEIMKRQSFLRTGMGKTFNLFVQIFLFRGIRDTQCGFKIFKKGVALKLFNLQKLRGFCFDAELLYIAKKLRYTVKEVPIRWINRKNSRVLLLKSSASMFFDIFRIKINDLLGYYGDK